MTFGQQVEPVLLARKGLIGLNNGYSRNLKPQPRAKSLTLGLSLKWKKNAVHLGQLQR